MQHHHTIIAGGGMAGMACGLKLREGGISPLMLTETLGSRVCYNPEQDMNYGAVFYMENYHNARKILTAGERLFSSYFQVKCHRIGADCYPLVSLRMLRNLPQLISFLYFMKRRFIPNYEAYKKYCETLPVREAMEKVPFIKELYFITAQELLERLKLPRATGDACRLDAQMLSPTLEEMEKHNVNLIFVENIGNLVCPAEFDLGEKLKVVILSVPEGDDKIFKYPLIFTVCDALIVNKTNYLTMPGCNFNMTVLRERTAGLNPRMAIFEVSAYTGEGIAGWSEWLADKAGLKNLQTRN